MGVQDWGRNLQVIITLLRGQTQTQPAQSEDRMGFVNYSLLALLLSTLFSRSDGSLFFNNPLRAATASLNQDEIYTGLMSTENQVIVIVQNFYAWVTSSIGFLLLIPFYQPRGTARGFSVEDYDSASSQSPWLSPLAVENMSWMLRYLADSIESFSPDYNYVQEF